jgi:uncharacterized membrane protein
MTLSILTVVSSIITLEAYNYMSSVLSHAMAIKGLSVAMLVLIGSLLFGESYTTTNLLGVALIVAGMILVNYK